MTQPSLTTERLLLRPFHHADAPTVQRLAGTWEVADTTLRIPHPYLDGMAESWIASLDPAFQEGRLATFAVTLAATGELVGAATLYREQPGEAELGYWIGVPFWGHGYATEAAAAVLRYGFETLGLDRVHAHFLARNPASGRVLQKAGLRFQETHRAAVEKWGRLEDVVVYALVAAEWRAGAASAPAAPCVAE